VSDCTQGPPIIEPCVVWFTGLSGAGKSTLALALYEQLIASGVAAEYLDGDVIRRLSPGIGFSRAHRDAHVGQVGQLASVHEARGAVVICALISPYRAARAEVRQRCRRFVEVYVSTPLAECERRDPKGLYARARRHEIAHFTGLDDPYEPPETPELTIDTTDTPVADAVARVAAVVAGSTAR
jgi:adenylyl-sulfate kinase